MKSLKELQAIRDKQKDAVRARNDAGIPTVNVHMGTCGIANGAREVYHAIMDEIQERGLKDIYVTQTGCPGICYEEPLVTLTVPGQTPYIYKRVSPENAKDIVARHIVNKQPIAEWLLNLES